MAPQAPAPGSRGLGRPRCGWVHADGGGAGQAARAPMDSRSPLSPRASAFSIASLVAAEAAERTARLGPGSSDWAKLHRLLESPAGMHFSTVTRDMEGEPPRCVYSDSPARLPAAAAVGPQQKELGGPGRRVGGGSSVRVGFRLPASTLGQRKGRHPAQSLCTLQPGDPAAETCNTTGHRPRKGLVEAGKDRRGGPEKGSRGGQELGEVGSKSCKKRVRESGNTGIGKRKS